MFYDLFNSKRIAGLTLSTIIVGSVAGCGASSAEIPAEITDITEKAVPQIAVTADYQVPVQVPATLVDQVGYSLEAEKVVVFKGENPPSQFSVCDAETGKSVYTGEVLKPVFSEELSDYSSLGYFNDLNTPGDYYIYTGDLGESYGFSVQRDVFKDVFSEAMKKYYINRCGIALSENYAGDSAHSACHTTAAHLQDSPSVTLDVGGGWHLDETAGRDTLLGSRIAEMLLLAYEMNPGAFSDDTRIPESGNKIPDILDEVKYETDWLLKMQDSRTGGEYGAAVTNVDKGGDVFAAPVIVTPVSMDATISFASMMARFSFFYQEYDPEFATLALKAADRAFTCFLKNRKASDDTAAFKAAVQLYRATGSDTYLDVINEYFERSDFEELFKSDENVFLGSVTYLTINQNVDVEKCTYLMKLLMKVSEDIAARATKSGYLVTDLGQGDDFGKMLSDMRTLTITDHIIYNYEYTTIIENHIHYLAGRNPEAVNYLTGTTDRSFADVGKRGVMNDPYSDALLIFMLSVLEQ